MLPILLKTTWVTIYSYPLFWGFSWAIGYYYSKSHLQEDLHRKLLVLFSSLFVVTWIGAKALFYLTLPTEWKAGVYVSENFWMGGGFSFFGGMISGIFCSLFFWFIWKKDCEKILNSVVVSIPLAHAVGRIGCFLAGCCYGVNSIPTQLIESLGLLGIFWLLKKRGSESPFGKIELYLFSYSLLRLLLDFLRADMAEVFWKFKETQLIAIGVLLLLVLNKLILKKWSY